jgi:hypothetical protein
MDDPLIDIDMHAKQASKQASKQPFVGHVHWFIYQKKENTITSFIT